MLKVIISILLISLPLVSHAEFYNGEELYDFGRSFKNVSKNDIKASTKSDVLYSGLFLGYVAANIESFGSAGAQVYCEPNGRLQTYGDVVFMYLSQHPERRVNSAKSLVIEAMQSNYRCTEPPQWLKDKVAKGKN